MKKIISVLVLISLINFYPTWAFAEVTTSSLGEIEPTEETIQSESGSEHTEIQRVVTKISSEEMTASSDDETANPMSEEAEPMERDSIIAGGWSTPHIVYKTYVQDLGWQKLVTDGATSGTVGKGKAILGKDMYFHGGGPGINQWIETGFHLADYGWDSDRAIYEEVLGQRFKKRLEAVHYTLVGTTLSRYNLYYRVHVQNFGWMGWAKNGEPAGTEGYGYRVEAMQVCFVPKNKPAPGSTANAFKKMPKLNYRANIQGAGWQNYVRNGKTSGAVGRGLRMEGLQAKIADYPSTGSVEYQAYIQNTGWQGWKANGATSGSVGKQLRIEAVRFRLTGRLGEEFDIYYRVYVEGTGWLDWAKNGAAAGTKGFAYRSEGIQIKLVKKGTTAPGKTQSSFFERIASERYFPKDVH
ncbi:hypothetical protein UAY_00534 [Enterococcus moraviensis ATCC BAA-383]|uniref:Clostridial hydrophobic W n=1 Tax=Enterococcus moraviensis ATCC BAA-383 TaxID=1158609 RepID=R2R809_9ENTE|nr:hypothetical protein [Enterococcus moraviensis]EOI05060.1 hypothetical protein UAY_00534 [Enterococcus moraviensis ATCC BAA-383]EOT63843.1 hypothetical protein I586_03276 [Enterococcus moraviensis ATCC BAA-383]OJG67025.1 hypothetical protein RV09_GL002934 [Enterococcus moraviensis]